MKKWLMALAALLVLVGIVMGIVFTGVLEDGQGSDTGEPRPRVPSLATKSPFRLSIEEMQGPDLPLKIEGISRESVVEGDVTRFYGSTVPDALVTVNGDIVDITDHGLFYTDVKLEPGTNIIEIVASDLTGRETAAFFTVVSLQ